MANDTLDMSKVSVHEIIAASIFATTSLLGIPGNLLVIIAVALSKQLQTSTNSFVVALAIVDLLTCLFLPIQFVSVLGLGKYVSFDRVCTVVAIFMSTSLGVSVSILTLISCNRFYLITKSKLDYDRLYTKRNIAVMITVATGAISIFNVIVVATELSTFGLDDGICSHIEGNAYAYPSGAWLLVSLIIIVVCYFRIYCHIKRHMRQVAVNPGTSDAPTIPNPKDSEFGKRQRELESKITANMLVIVVLFFVCVAPSIVLLFVPDDRYFSAVVVAIIAFNSCVNPLVYGWKHPVFRNVFKCILTWRISQIREPTHWARSLVGTNA